MDDPIIVTGKPFQRAISYLLVGILTGVLGAWIIYNAFGILLVFVSIWFLYSALTLNQIRVFEDRIEVISIFKLYFRHIRFSDITGWTEVIQKGRHRKQYQLIFCTKAVRYKILSDVYEEYDLIKEEFARNKPIDLFLQRKYYRLQDIYDSFSVFLFGLSFSVLSGYFYWENKKEIIPIEFKSVLIEYPSIQKPSKGSSYMILRMSQNPKINFEIKGLAYKKINESKFFDKVNIGDTLIITVDSDIYHRHIDKQVSLTFFDKYFRFEIASIYGLRTENRVYLVSSKDIIEDYKPSPISMWILGGFGLLLILSSTVMLSNLAAKNNLSN